MLTSFFKFNTGKTIFISISFLLFFFLILRATYAPMYGDELYTYFFYVKPANLNPLGEFKLPNNHLANTYLTTLSYNVFGNSPLSLRLFNVLSFIPFVVFLFKIGTYLQSKISRWIFYISILFSLNFVSYFGLSRGYGLSFSFLIIAIFYTLKTFRNTTWHNVIFVSIFLVLALYSNFALLNTVGLLFLIVGINFYIKSNFTLNKSDITKGVVIGVFILAALFGALYIMLDYKNSGMLWWGNLDGFIQTTLVSLINLLFNEPSQLSLIKLGVIISVIIMVIMFLFTKKYSAKNVFFYLLLFNVIIVIFQAEILEVNYPYERVGLHFFIFFVGSFCFLVDQFKTYVFKLLLLPLLLIPVHFVSEFNLVNISCWEGHSIPHRFFQKIEESEKNKNEIPTIYMGTVANTCWSYKLDRFDSNLPNVTEYFSDDVQGYYDYFIGKKELIDEDISYYDSLDYDSHSNFILLKRRNKVGRKLIKQVSFKEKTTTESEFIEFARFNIDSLQSQALYVENNLFIKPIKTPYRGKLVVSIKNLTTGDNVGYKSNRLETWSLKDFKKGIMHGEYLYNLPVNTPLEIVVYIWNEKKENLDTQESHLVFSEAYKNN